MKKSRHQNILFKNVSQIFKLRETCIKMSLMCTKNVDMCWEKTWKLEKETNEPHKKTRKETAANCEKINKKNTGGKTQARAIVMG